MALQDASADGGRLFRLLVERANRFNVSFYPFDTRGLAVFDQSLGARDDRIRNDPGEPSENARGIRDSLSRDMSRASSRVASLQTLAEATDGLAVVNTNDLAGGARRIATDLSAYYLLGYQSTNTKLDGGWRAIAVTSRAPGVRIRARKGYRALTEKDVALMRRRAALRPGSLRRAARQRPWRARRRCRAPWTRWPASVARCRGDRVLPGSSPTPSGGTRIRIASDLGEATLRQPEWAGAAR